MSDIWIEFGMPAGLMVELREDAELLNKAMKQIPVRAARGTRASLQRQIRARFGRKPTRGGKPFPDTLPKIPNRLDELGPGQYGATVRTKAFFRKRRHVMFDLFAIFDASPRIIVSGRGRHLAVPIPGARIPVVGAGATRKLAWPRDLRGQGWKTSVLPAGRAGNKNPIIMGGPPGSTRKSFKPMYVLVPQVGIRKRLDVTKTADRYHRRMDEYADKALKDVLGRKVRTRQVRYS